MSSTSYKDFSTTERRIIVGSILTILLVALLFWKGEDWFWNEEVAASTQEEVGQIIVRENDVRFRSSSARIWYKAKQSQSVRNGDAVFTGKKSKSQVRLKDGGAIDLGENSLVAFDMLDRKKVANLRDGSFKLKIDGTVKIAIQGKMTTFEGKKSELQVTLGADKKPKLKLLTGEIQVKLKDKPQVKLVEKSLIKLAQNSPTPTPTPVAGVSATPTPVEPDQETNELTIEDVSPELEKNIVAIATPEPLQEQVQPIAEVPTPTPTPELLVATAQEIAKLKNKSQTLRYVWELYDLYEKKDGHLAAKATQPMRIEFQHELEWELNGSDQAQVQIARDAEFREAKTLPGSAGKLKLEEVFVGENFWRIGTSTGNWSAAEKFTVTTEFLSGAEPQVQVNENNLELRGQVVVAAVQLKSSVSTIGFVAEASNTGNFQESGTRTFWTPSPTFNLSFYHAGEYFYRFRAVSTEQKLSPWSNPVKFNVFTPEVIKPPVLAQIKPIKKEEAPVVVKATPTPRPKVKPEQKKAVAKVDLKKEEPKKVERKTAATESSTSMKIEPDKSGPASNERYKSTRISLNGFIWTIQSSTQYFQSSAAPVASGIGFHGLLWRGNHGLEGSYKNGILGFNSAGNQTTSLKDLEARYHYRFYTGLPFKFSRELQISLFGGFETYRNSATNFASKYDLMKFGTSLEFPVFRHWSTGGEFVYGVASDKSNKKEISGNLNYFFDNMWSFGVGYRIHLFEAGSTATSPNSTLPYREGYTEGFSTLNYHY